jgi:hypothetical protein
LALLEVYTAEAEAGGLLAREALVVLPAAVEAEVDVGELLVRDVLEALLAAGVPPAAGVPLAAADQET